jgi:transposase-like protein
MQQIYHSNATTNLHNREQIQKSLAKNSELALQFNTSKQTISKWKNRESLQDKSSRPLNIEYALSDLEKAIIKSIRTASWIPLDEVLDMFEEAHRKVSRSSVYRYLVQEKINKVPKEQKEKAKKFKEYEPGYLHIDVTYLPKFEGKAAYLFVAIDRCTRLMVYKVYDAKTADNTVDFMDECLAYFPFELTHILTENGLEFTNRLLVSRKGVKCLKPSKMDVKCQENEIEHRLTAPFTPKTNGMVERVNGIIKNDTILKTDYQNAKEMRTDLYRFMVYYNMYRRHGSLVKELQVKTPFNALQKWYKLKPEIFKKTPEEFQKYLLDLQTILNNLYQ